MPVRLVKDENQKYTTVEARAKSFEKYEKKSTMGVDVATLSEAGFFFEGIL